MNRVEHTVKEKSYVPKDATAIVLFPPNGLAK